jgi:threonine/homoserine/homoserine lactone efflux protein
MQFLFFFKGVGLGLAIALAVGPVAILCVRRTLTHGWFYGFLTTFGTAFGDFLYAYLAQFGAPFVLHFIDAYGLLFRFISGLFLLFIGYHIYVSRVEDPNISVVNRDLPEDFLATFLLTFTNPLPILFLSTSFAAILHTTPSAVKSDLMMLPFGVFAGSALWWLVLAFGASLFSGYVNKKRLQMINKITGIALMLFGIFFMLFVFFGFVESKTHFVGRIWPTVRENLSFGPFGDDAASSPSITSP